MIFLLLISTLLLGTMVTLTSTHWLMAWVGLEMNTLALIPMISKGHPRAAEAAIKYLLTQAAASTTILFSATVHALVNGTWNITLLTPPAAIPITLALCMKLGLAPLHFWYTDVLLGVPLTLGLIISTWQKIAPMALLILISKSTDMALLITLGLLSVMVGGWGGINQTQLRKILAFSSIAHMGWFIIVLKFSIPLALLTFFIYFVLSSALFINLITLRMTTLTQFSTAWSKSPTLALITLLAILSTAGMPPLAGFTPKLLISLELAKTSPILVGTLFLTSLLPLYFYLRMVYATALTAPTLPPPYASPWRPPQKLFPLLAMINLLTLTILPIAPFLLF